MICIEPHLVCGSMLRFWEGKSWAIRQNVPGDSGHFAEKYELPVNSSPSAVDTRITICYNSVTLKLE